jgi:hypothetical protein
MAMSVSRPHAAPSSPQRCAFIGERAATRGRSAREGGGEHAGGKRESPARHANRNARGERREQGHARSSIIYFPAGNDAALIDERAAAGASMSHRAMCEGMPARLSKSAQRNFTDCLATLGQCVGLLQVFDADRAERLRLG